MKSGVGNWDSSKPPPPFHFVSMETIGEYNTRLLLFVRLPVRCVAYRYRLVVDPHVVSHATLPQSSPTNRPTNIPTEQSYKYHNHH